jgi:hypothetical protein
MLEVEHYRDARGSLESRNKVSLEKFLKIMISSFEKSFLKWSYQWFGMSDCLMRLAELKLNEPVKV